MSPKNPPKAGVPAVQSPNTVVPVDVDSKAGMPPKLSVKLAELELKGDLERVKNFGKAIGVLGELVKTGRIAVEHAGKRKILVERRMIVGLEVEKLVIRLQTQQSGDDADLQKIRAHRDTLQSTIREDIPALLELLPEVSPEDRAAIVTALVSKLPTLTIKVD